MKISRKLKSLGLVAIMCVGLVGCASTETPSDKSNTNQTATKGYPVEITTYKYNGDEIKTTYDKAPQKVLAVYQGSIETMLELGLEDKLIAAAGLDNELDEKYKEAFDKVEYLTEFTPSKETVTMLNPDMILSWGSIFSDEKLGDVNTWIEKGCNTYINTNTRRKEGEKRTIQNEMTDILNLGKIFNVEDKANTLATELSESLKSVEDKVSTLEGEPLKVLVMTAYNDGSYNVFGANSTLQNEILEVLGGTNVNEKGGAQSLENLMSLNPDVILYVYNNKNLETDSVAVESLYNNSLIQSVPAIENKKVFEVSYTEFMGYGYRTIECIENLAKEMYPELFK